jgi:hypothetical protein
LLYFLGTIALIVFFTVYKGAPASSSIKLPSKVFLIAFGIGGESRSSSPSSSPCLRSFASSDERSSVAELKSAPQTTVSFPAAAGMGML